MALSCTARLTLLVWLALAAGCATGGIYARDPSHLVCNPCDPAAADPDTLDVRVVLIGDAGEPLTADNTAGIDATLEAIGRAAIPGKTVILFLGDNLYPRGLPARGEPGRSIGEEVLTRQLRVVGPGVLSVVVPGNHDWDQSGVRGLARVRDQADFVNGSAAAGEARFEPAGGCPGPTYMDVGIRETADGATRPRLRLVFFDSEWLLRSRDKTTVDCAWGSVDAPVPYGRSTNGSVTNTDVAEKLREVIAPDRDVLLASHHPVRTEGSHAGRYRWWLAPFVVPFRHWLWRSPQDMISAENEAMREVVASAMAADHRRPIFHVAGHEHGLQVFEGQLDAPAGTDPAGAMYLVSGAGSKAGALAKAADTLFKHGALGFMTLDFMTDDRILLRVVEPDRPRPVYVHWVR